ncbi:MAG: hypothetical protein RIG63_15860, partial [Coleofasciculus chthonoplastes F3-SA18-01]|uniref:hypothetical protein n=1 Tax=Coleofasciculus chthonoplastes TaxID=64178 RepID=UPI0032F958C5
MLEGGFLGGIGERILEPLPAVTSLITVVFPLPLSLMGGTGGTGETFTLKLVATSILILLTLP